MSAGRAVQGGIDEAGLGPLLGPLTLGYAAFRAPRGHARLWDLLPTAVSETLPCKDGRVVVADSKLVFTRDPAGHARLETTALAFLALRGRAVWSGRALLRTPPAPLRPAREILAEHPWYALLPRRLPLWAEGAAVEAATARLAVALEAAGVELCAAGVRAVPEGELNASFERTGNKSVSHWIAVSRLVEHLWKRHAGEGLELIVDRLGGRLRYGEMLAQLFPFSAVETAREERPLSCYSVAATAGPPRRAEITFAERGEGRSMAVALASCFAKYARELCMHAFNRYFCRLQRDLKPTAGYRNDAWRWLEDARETLERSALDRRLFVRDR